MLSVVRLVAFLSGTAHITVPNSKDEGVWLVGGVNGLVVAADTTGEGHITDYPSDRVTTALALPFANGVIPPYEVVGKGKCESSVGYESLTSLLF